MRSRVARVQSNGSREYLSESRPWPGNVFPWVLAALVCGFLLVDCGFRGEVMRQITDVQTNEVPVLESNLAAGARLRNFVLPPTAMDSRWWVMHTEALIQQGAWRVRETRLDNAPAGREVHWNSAIPWVLSALAAFHAEPGEQKWNAVARASFSFAPLTLVAALIVFCMVGVRAFGWGPTVLFVAAFCLCPLVYSEFRPGQVDHHGLVAALAAASVLSLLAGGAGNVLRAGVVAIPGCPSTRSLEVARRRFIAAGIFGGAALWVSAASYIPVLVGIGIGAFAAAALRDRTATEASPGLWRTWGIAGCLTSLAFYLIEYFPNHMGFRLEVNHPLYALAWLGAGDLISRVCGWRAGQHPFPSGWKSWVIAGASMVAIAAPALVIATAAHQTFWVADRFLLLLHNEYIQEFQTFFEIFRENPSVVAIWEYFGIPILILIGAGFLFGTNRIAPAWRASFALLLPPALVTFGLALWQVRWSVISLSIWTLGVLLLAAAYTNRTGRRSRIFEWGVVAAFLVAFCGLPVASLLGWSHREQLAHHLPKSAIPSVLARDVSQRLLQASPDRLPRILAAPTTSTDLTYFSGAETLGTLYWENLDGLKRAAGIFGKATEAEAKAAIVDADITHILVATWDDFGSAYVSLLQKAGLTDVKPEDTFLAKLLTEKEPPDWLRPLYYPIPEGFNITEHLKLFAVIPNQTPSEARLHLGIYAVDAGDRERALEILEPLLVANPGNLQLLRLVNAARRLPRNPPTLSTQPTHETPSP